MNPTKEQKKYYDRLANEIGCCVCRFHHGYKNTYVSIHHINGRKDNWNVLALCSEHHQTGGEGIAIHPFKAVWERIYGTQEYLKYRCDKLLDKCVKK